MRGDTMTDRGGRRMIARIRARGWLRTESPLHVGGLSSDPSDALPIAVDGLGRLYVPGTTLAGVLRHWMLGAAAWLRTPPDPADEDPYELNELWGYVPEGNDDERARASRVIVADALIATDIRLDEYGLPAALLDPGRLEFRPSVGIDRRTGAAAPEFLYGRAVIPVGHYIRLALDIECYRDPERDEARMGAMLAALADGEIRVGAATGKGFGAVRLLEDGLELVVDRFDSPEGLLAALRGTRSGDRVRTLDTLRRTDANLPPRRRWLKVRVEWRPIAPVMVRSGTRGLIVDTLPLTTRVDDRHVTLVLPGSSIKGALRSHAELVERVARGLEPEDPDPDESAARQSAAFRRQLDELPMVRRLFGSVRDDEPPGDGEERRAGAIRVAECTSLVTIPETLWRSVAGTDVDTPPTDDKRLPEQVRDRLEDLGMAQADHVALDRWTGGAANGRLYSVIEPYAVAWEPIDIAVDLTRLDGDRTALALLLLTLRDLAAGRIPLGASTNRGFGDIEVTKITLTDGERWPEPTPLAEALHDPGIADIAAAWTSYVEAS
jgi:Uncharacterized protein predicted to be involved in DNA repair (RAMP superfamily)